MGSNPTLSAISKAAEAGKGSGIRVIIGENMDRVKDYASAKGAQTIEDWLTATGRTWDETANSDWVRWIIQEGHEVIDIGPDFGRRFDYFVNPAFLGSRPPSKIYGFERLELLNYANYQRVFERNGRFWGGVPEFDPPSVIKPSK